METIAPPRPFVERRRPHSVAPRGVDFIERRRPTPVLLRDIDDLHDVDLDDVVADKLAEGYGVPTDPFAAFATATALARLIGQSGPVAFRAHGLGS